LEQARGACLFDRDGRRYIDFLAGAGAVNYGHNNPRLNQALIKHLERDGIVQALDMSTTARQAFLDRFAATILEPRGLDYVVQLTGPSGANAIESALKLARLTRRRSLVVAFTNAYHGLTLGALAVTANSQFRNELFVSRMNVSFVPYDGYFGPAVDTLAYLRKLIDDPASGLDVPAAILVETVQAEGGVNVASASWLRGLAALCRDCGALLIVDDIQVGCGRTGPFFSFERAGIEPDIVVMSKSISGAGLPMSLLLLKPELDQWARGEEAGTFRGHTLAFVAATEALFYWETGDLSEQVDRKGGIVQQRLLVIARRHPEFDAGIRGIGLIWALDLRRSKIAEAASRAAFARGLIVERCGPRDTALKILPPLVIEDDLLEEGLSIIDAALTAVIKEHPKHANA